VGDVFGALTLVAYSGQEAPDNTVTYSYKVTNNSTCDVHDIVINDDKLGYIAGPFDLGMGASSSTFTKDAEIFSTTTNVATASGHKGSPSGDLCEGTDDATVTVGEDPGDPPGGGEDVCASGPPKTLTLKYTGDSCAATAHHQDPSGVGCSGDPMDKTPVKILISDKSTPSAKRAKIFFNGFVTLNEEFLFDSAAAGASKIPPNSYFFNDLNGVRVQTVNIHTSCSQPLFEGDQFGSILITGFSH
jgi:hypothetical protein